MAARIHTAPRAAPRRPRLRLVVAAVALATVAACAFQSLQDLDADIERAGLEDVSTRVDAANGSVIVVSASAPQGQTVEDAQDEVAEVVWTSFPHRFDRLRVTIDDEAESWTYSDLETDLGDRPSSLDEGADIGDELNRTTLFAGLGILGAGVLAIAFIALVLVLVLRATRRSAARRPPLQPWMPPGGWAPAPPPGGWAAASAPPGPPGAPGSPAPPGPEPVAPPTTSTPAPAPPSLAKDQTGTGPVPPLPPPPVAPPGKRPKDPDARRLGRRPRGRTPDTAHTPPGWG